MTTAIEHIEKALDELESAEGKLDDEIGTQMMVQQIIEDTEGIASRYKRINGE